MTIVDFVSLFTRENVADVAHVLTAIGTVSAAWAAVWAARRAETPRLKLFPGLEYVLTVGEGLDEQHKLRLSVVNTGLLPITVTGVHLTFFFSGGRPPWSISLQPRDSTLHEGRFPCRLEHGEEVSVLYTVSWWTEPWSKLSSYWWCWRRPMFSVSTTFRTNYAVRPGVRSLRALKRDVEESYGRARAKA